MTLVEFSTLLSVFIVLSEVALILGWWTYFVSSRFRTWSWELLSEHGWMVATLIVAVISMIGSLIYSHVYDLPVCMLCYYQRLCMYPLVLFVGIAVWKKDYFFVKLPALILSLIGVAFAWFHYYYHVLSFFTDKTIIMPCSAIGLVPSCSDKHILIFGHITIPLMALIAFILIASGLYLSSMTTNQKNMKIGKKI